uniref:bifunctional folylpolyglutamate synthase/dihydrofolate synthase n=1 Tax=Roseivirga sp. TaxID=1964215 RepID=UPI004047DEDE
MNYHQTLDYLFSALPMYQRIGNSAFKKDLTNTLKLCEALGNPQNDFKSIHIAGTNGKGSSSHMIASVLQSAGYKVGLYTSPHLKSFTERIRINGQPIEEQEVVDFVARLKPTIDQVQPSFFEMTVAMAFDYFRNEKVDVAVIEVGLGGRLDSTNVITPEISLITNIGFDHMDMLGDTLEKIAFEKAGIIKENIPVVIGEIQLETKPVFLKIAKERNANITFADQFGLNWNQYELDLFGSYQQKNIKGVLVTMNKLKNLGWKITEENIKEGLCQVRSKTGLKGRWQQLSKSPLIICDTGHNKEAFDYIIPQIKATPHKQLFMVLGFVNDKKLDELIPKLPKGACFVFCEAKVPRAMKLAQLKTLTEPFDLKAEYVADVNEAIQFAKSKANKDDMIYIGGSTFVVAEIEDL